MNREDLLNQVCRTIRNLREAEEMARILAEATENRYLAHALHSLENASKLLVDTVESINSSAPPKVFELEQKVAAKKDFSPQLYNGKFLNIAPVGTVGEITKFRFSEEQGQWQYYVTVNPDRNIGFWANHDEIRSINE